MFGNRLTSGIWHFSDLRRRWVIGIILADGQFGSLRGSLPGVFPRRAMRARLNRPIRLPWKLLIARLWTSLRGHGLRAKRSKSGAVSFEVIEMEGTDAPGSRNLKAVQLVRASSDHCLQCGNASQAGSRRTF
jgi:hypothetical protein